MQLLEFAKLNGSGNDFIVIDNRAGLLGPERLPDVARTLCRRRFSVGADGLIAIEPSRRADFRWRFYNADGGEAAMCGNGGRCAARFAFLKGISGPRLSFETLAGIIRAEVDGKRVKLELLPPEGLRQDVTIAIEGGDCVLMDTLVVGVPHAVIFTDGLDSWDVCGVGRFIRYHPFFQPEGTNVNFVSVRGPSEIAIRTYERGVEDETMACGTGSVASALLAALRYELVSPVAVRTRGGEVLSVYFTLEDDTFKEVFLEGDTAWVYDGRLTPEALQGT